MIMTSSVAINTHHNPQPSTSFIYNRVEATKDTPFIEYSELANYLVIKGNSYGLNVYDFYQPVIDSFKTKFKDGESCHVDLSFDKLNTSSAKILFDLFKFLRTKQKAGARTKVIWRSHKNDIDMYKTGMDFAEIFDLTFTMVNR